MFVCVCLEKGWIGGAAQFHPELNVNSVVKKNIADISDTSVCYSFYVLGFSD